MTCWTLTTRASFARLLPRWLLIGSLLMVLSGCQMAADTQNLQGVRLFQQGQYQPAMQQFQAALRTDPKNADATYNMAATLHRMGVQNQDQAALKQAEQLYNQALDIDKHNADAYRGLAVLLAETGRSEKAFTLMKNWANGEPNDANARVELARLYQEFGDLETAKMHLNNAVMIDQYNYRAWAALGSIREQTGDLDQALANYQRSLNLNQFQANISQRVAALNHSLQSSAANATRTVTTPPPIRY